MSEVSETPQAAYELPHDNLESKSSSKQNSSKALSKVSSK